jgi:uncharacterized membrane protein
LTAANWILDSRQLSRIDRDAILNAMTPFGSRKELPALATLTQDICIAFGASFVNNLKITTFAHPIVALSCFLDLTDDPSTANSIAAMPTLSRDKTLLEAAKKAQAARFADGRSLSSILTAFRASRATVNPFAFDGPPVFSLSKLELEQLQMLSKELNWADEMNRHDLSENGRKLGLQFMKKPSIQLLGKLLAISRQTITLILKKKPSTIQCL